MWPKAFGHCPFSDCTPPPALKRALWGTSFRKKCPKPCGQGSDPQNQANSSPKSCPKPALSYFQRGCGNRTGYLGTRVLGYQGARDRVLGYQGTRDRGTWVPGYLGTRQLQTLLKKKKTSLKYARFQISQCV